MESGSKLGHYEISTLLGKGGMGEVWRARDTKLGREVAIKTLPEEFARDADRLARFEREAKLLASLNHPNIAAIHGFEEDNGTHFLVLELVEGDTLADRLKRGAIPIEESLRLALQIAEALEAAHEKGVIHRDLKPANIKVTGDGKVKVLDFGLAKAFASDQAEANLSNSPTLSMQATQQGVILGTAAYMSPEQAKGLPADKRADVFAFGCVLFEMMTGRQTFDGQLATEILASVIRAEPDYTALHTNLHPEIKKLLRRCLEKEPMRRFRDVGDVRFEIEQVLADTSGVLVRPDAEVVQRSTQSKLPWVGGFALGLAIAGIAVWTLKPDAPAVVSRFYHLLPDDQGFGNTGALPVVAISPDTNQIVYAANGQLYLRPLNDVEARPLFGTDEVPANPFFSPDGEWIGYASIADQQLKKIPVGGGAPVTLSDVNVQGLWGHTGTRTNRSSLAWTRPSCAFPRTAGLPNRWLRLLVGRFRRFLKSCRMAIPCCFLSPRTSTRPRLSCIPWTRANRRSSSTACMPSIYRPVTSCMSRETCCSPYRSIRQRSRF